jgi:hypothetical protein
LLSSWGVAFEGVDVEANPEASAELARRGIPRVPAVIAGEQAVHGWNPRALAALVGAPYAEPARLPPPELARRLDRVLAAAQRAMRQVPDAKLALKTPDRDRTVRQLGYHLFRLSLAYRGAMETGTLPEAWIAELPPPELLDGAAIAGYGDTVRDALAAWFRGPAACEGVVDTYYGPQGAHELLERTTWHAAQHLRQLYALLDRMGVTPEDPLADADFQGLPLPRELWS